MRKVLCLVLCIAAGMLGCSTAWGAYQAKGKRDPFVPLLSADGQRIYPPGTDDEEAAGVEGLVLQGIVFDPGTQSYAVISGEIVRENESVGSVQVIQIEKEAVTVLVDGESHRLTLPRVQMDGLKESE